MICLLRHGDAEDGAGKPDADRALTKKGERQSLDAGAALKQLGVKIDACLTSPKERAKASAELACKPLGVSVEEDGRLAGGDFDPFALAAGRGEVLLVGHEPDFSHAVFVATGGHVKMKKGGLAAIDGGQLHALLRPKDLRGIASS
jgi:phosphohistidine phosphatase